MMFLFAAALCFTVTATPVRTIDGDTFDAVVSYWLNTQSTERIRVLNIDTPEMKKATMVRALQAKAFTAQWLDKGPFQIDVCRRDVFGRLLAVVFRGDEVLADELRKAGHVKK